VSIPATEFVENWNSPWDLIRLMINYHVRVKKNAHMINSELCPGYPNKFQFGQTSFVEPEEARELLRHAFINIDNRGHPRPVIFIGHAIDNDIKVIKDRFGFDIEALGVVVAILDTQVLATESGHVNGYERIRLGDLMCRYDINEEYLHNAGNDTVCTMVAAMLMATGQSSAGLPAPYQELKQFHRLYSHLFQIPRFGIHMYCELCESTNHFASHHEADSFVCNLCRKDALLSKNFRTHPTDKCLEGIKAAAKAAIQQDPEDSDSEEETSMRWYPIPCLLCIQSTDPSRYI
jgi:hypothetical protein